MIDVINKLEEIKKNVTNIFFKESKENRNNIVFSKIVSSDVDVPLAKSEQINFDYPPALFIFNACICTDPKYGGTQFSAYNKESAYDEEGGYGWISGTEKFLKPEEVKQIMIGYIEQIPEEGASEENWVSYFCDKYGFDFFTTC